MNLSSVTPAIFCKNEEFWIHYVLRDLLKVFDNVILLDTGSQDATKDIARETAKASSGKLTLIEEDFGDDPHKIGNSSNILREEVKTYWMLLLAGDEILRKEQLLNLRRIEIDSHKYKVGMIRSTNVEDVGGTLQWRSDHFHADKFFDPTIKWVATEYPFEGYNQHIYAKQGMLYYLDVEAFFNWHVRCCKRSSLDAEVYFRLHKMHYFDYKGPYFDMPNNWLGEIAPYPNPYLNGEVTEEETDDTNNSGNAL